MLVCLNARLSKSGSPAVLASAAGAAAGRASGAPKDGPQPENLGLEGEQKTLAFAVAHRQIPDESLVRHALTLADGVGVRKRRLGLGEVGLERRHLGHLGLERGEMECPPLAAIE